MDGANTGRLCGGYRTDATVRRRAEAERSTGRAKRRRELLHKLLRVRKPVSHCVLVDLAVVMAVLRTICSKFCLPPLSVARHHFQTRSTLNYEQRWLYGPNIYEQFLLSSFARGESPGFSIAAAFAIFSDWTVCGGAFRNRVGSTSIR